MCAARYFVVRWLDDTSLKYDTVQSKDIIPLMSCQMYCSYLQEYNVQLFSKERSLVLKLLLLVSFNCASLYMFRVVASRLC